MRDKIAQIVQNRPNFRVLSAKKIHRLEKVICFSFSLPTKHFLILQCRRIYLIMKRRSSSLMDHSLAFCLLISGDSQYLPFWRIISNTQWLSTSSLLMQYNPDYNYNTSVSNAFFCLLISGDSKYLPFWWIISSKIRNVYQCHHFLVLMQYNHDFDYNPSVWNAFFCLLIYGDSQYCPFWRSISSSNILQWFSISSLFLWNTFKTLIYIPLSETVQNENLFCSCWLYV